MTVVITVSFTCPLRAGQAVRVSKEKPRILPSYSGGGGRRITVHFQLGKTIELYLKSKLKAKRTGGVAQVIEHPLCKCKALSSDPSNTKKQKKKVTQAKRMST
jgi:hypothetical protein